MEKVINFACLNIFNSSQWLVFVKKNWLQVRWQKGCPYLNEVKFLLQSVNDGIKLKRLLSDIKSWSLSLFSQSKWDLCDNFFDSFKYLF